MGDLDSDEAKTHRKRTKEQVQAKNRNKYKPRTETRTAPSNQTRRQAGGLLPHVCSTCFTSSVVTATATTLLLPLDILLLARVHLKSKIDCNNASLGFMFHILCSSVLLATRM